MTSIISYVISMLFDHERRIRALEARSADLNQATQQLSQERQSLQASIDKETKT